jgi:hypothetical protein
MMRLLRPPTASLLLLLLDQGISPRHILLNEGLAHAGHTLGLLPVIVFYSFI